MKILSLLIIALCFVNLSFGQTAPNEVAGYIIKGKVKKEVTFIIPTLGQRIDERKIQQRIRYKQANRKSSVTPKTADSLVFDWNDEKVVVVSKAYKVGNTIPKRSFLIPHVVGKITYYRLAMELYNKARNDVRSGSSFGAPGSKRNNGEDYVYHSYVEKNGKTRYIPDLYKKSYMKKFVSDCDYIINDFNGGKWNKADIMDIVKAYNENCSK